MTRVNVLFIGESPPARRNGFHHFYVMNTTLFRNTKQAFQDAFQRNYLDNNEFIKEFGKLGCYLDDLFRSPIDGVPNDLRIQFSQRCIEGLASRIICLNPRKIVVVLVRIDSFVTTAIQMAGWGDSPSLVLPFPARPDHKDRYVEGLTGFLRTCMAENVFDENGVRSN